MPRGRGNVCQFTRVQITTNKCLAASTHLGQDMKNVKSWLGRYPWVGTSLITPSLFVCLLFAAPLYSRNTASTTQVEHFIPLGHGNGLSFHRRLTNPALNMGNVEGQFAQFSNDVNTAFADLSRQIEQGLQVQRPGTSARQNASPRANFLSAHFRHAVDLITQYLTVEECFRVMVLDKTLYEFMSSHAYTWRCLFERVCRASGEPGRFEEERALLVEQQLSPVREVKYLQQRILHHLQDRLKYEEQHFRALLPYNRLLYRYCDKFSQTAHGSVNSHGLVGLSCNLFKFPSRALAECLSLKRKTAARCCVMDTFMHPQAFKKSLPRGYQRGQSSVSYLALDMATAAPETRDALPDLTGVPGFIGYAYNLCELRPEHEATLRNTICWSAFFHLAVFETEAQGEAYAATLPPESKFWFCGLDFAPPADRLNEARFGRGYNFAYGDQFRPMMLDMLVRKITPEAQLQKIERKIHLLNTALELSAVQEMSSPSSEQ